MANDVEQRVMCLLAICISSLEKFLLRAFALIAYFYIGLLSFCYWWIVEWDSLSPAAFSE